MQGQPAGAVIGGRAARGGRRTIGESTSPYPKRREGLRGGRRRTSARSYSVRGGLRYMVSESSQDGHPRPPEASAAAWWEAHASPSPSLRSGGGGGGRTRGCKLRGGATGPGRRPPAGQSGGRAARRGAPPPVRRRGRFSWLRTPRWRRVACVAGALEDASSVGVTSGACRGGEGWRLTARDRRRGQRRETGGEDRGRDRGEAQAGHRGEDTSRGHKQRGAFSVLRGIKILVFSSCSAAPSSLVCHPPSRTAATPPRLPDALCSATTPEGITCRPRQPKARPVAQVLVLLCLSSCSCALLVLVLAHTRFGLSVRQGSCPIKYSADGKRLCMDALCKGQMGLSMQCLAYVRFSLVHIRVLPCPPARCSATARPPTAASP